MERRIYRQTRQLEDEHWWFMGRRRIIQHIISRLDLPKKPQILEAGCGTGGNLAFLAQMGQVIGLEPDHEAAQMALARDICPVYSGSLPDDVPTFPHSFDLILLLDVLEHIEDDLSALRKINALLAPGAYLVLTVPAFPFLLNQHDEEHHHQRRYRQPALNQVIKSAGLKVRHITYYNFWLFPVAVVRRLISRAFPSKSGESDLKPCHPWLNQLLLTIFSSERHALRWAHLPFGLSLLAITKKDELWPKTLP